MSDSEFFDTNILVYAYDKSSGAKNKAAEILVEEVFEGNRKGNISNQVLSELFYVLTEKVGHPLKRSVAVGIIRKYDLSEKWTKINYKTKTAVKAALTASRTGAHFWDALIVETMTENNITSIVTENERDFAKVPGIKIHNPFK